MTRAPRAATMRHRSGRELDGIAEPSFAVKQDGLVVERNETVPTAASENSRRNGAILARFHRHSYFAQPRNELAV